jgi:hypothetical protein
MQRPGATEGDQGKPDGSTPRATLTLRSALHVGRDHRQGPFGFDALPGKRLAAPLRRASPAHRDLSGMRPSTTLASVTVGSCHLVRRRPGPLCAADRGPTVTVAGVGRHDRPSRPDGDHIQ